MNKRMEEIRARKEEIRNMLETGEKIDMSSIKEELRKLDAEQKELEERAKMAEAINEGNPAIKVEERKKPEQRKESDMENKYESVEYRKAFMDYVLRGKAIPMEYRSDAVTSTTDIGALVPPTTLNKVVEEIKSYGMILPLVTKTAYPNGISIPKSDVKPVATWVNEGAGSDKQKKTTGSIVFAHHKLRCAVAVTLEAEYMSYSAFEAAVVSNMAEAMARALEEAIITGDGNGKPEGILKNTANGVTINYGSLTYNALTKAEGELPQAYENGAVWVMSKKTFMGFVGMTDSNGQPIARVNAGINGVPQRTLLGRTVVLTEYVPSFADTLTEGTVFAFLYKMSDYCLNTNFNIGMKIYEDNDTDDIVRKSIMVCDGKPVDTHSLVKLAYKADAKGATA